MNEHSERLAIVVDTNLFVSGAISPRGAPYRLLLAWYDKRFQLLLSNEQYVELMDVLQRPRLAPRFRLSGADFARMLAGFAEATRVDTSLVGPVSVRDPKDVPILAAALGGEADYLVTGDADLLALRGDPQLGKLRILTVTESLAILGDA